MLYERMYLFVLELMHLVLLAVQVGVLAPHDHVWSLHYNHEVGLFFVLLFVFKWTNHHISHHASTKSTNTVFCDKIGTKSAKTNNFILFIDSPVSPSPHVESLGVILESTLSCQSHINNLSVLPSEKHLLPASVSLLQQHCCSGPQPGRMQPRLL